MSKPKHTDPTSYCPLWRKKCVSVCHTCEFWDHVRGKHPQTNADVDHWACAIKMTVMLSIENTQAQRGTMASIDQFRKEVHTANDQAMVSAIARLNQNIGVANGTIGADNSPPVRMLEG